MAHREEGAQATSEPSHLTGTWGGGGGDTRYLSLASRSSRTPQTRLGAFQRQKPPSRIPKAASPRSGLRQIWCLVRTLSGSRVAIGSLSLPGGREEGAAWGLLCQGTSPTHQGSSLVASSPSGSPTSGYHPVEG